MSLALYDDNIIIIVLTQTNRIIKKLKEKLSTRKNCTNERDYYMRKHIGSFHPKDLERHCSDG